MLVGESSLDRHDTHKFAVFGLFCDSFFFVISLSV